MQIFISYNSRDISLVRRISQQIGCLADVKFWDQDKMPGEAVWDQIYDWIEDSDLVLALITDNSIDRAMAVSHELTHAKELDKPIIPLVAHNVPDSDLGFLSGITYIRIDKDNPGFALEQLARHIQKLKGDEIRNMLLILGGIIFFIWLMRKPSA